MMLPRGCYNATSFVDLSFAVDPCFHSDITLPMHGREHICGGQSSTYGDAMPLHSIPTALNNYAHPNRH